MRIPRPALSISRRLATALAVASLAWGPPAAAKTHALLVGATWYQHKDDSFHLEGPANDVELLAEVLTRAGFGVAAADVVRLAGWPEDEAARPTRANIERELERLAAVAGDGDQVVVLLAGHGSQQPADDDPDDPEPDGMDEIFLPADVGEWNDETGRVEGAVTDDEIGRWLDAIRAKGAFVWALIDTCHSGTMTRGGGERQRSVPPAALGIPAAAARDPSAALPDGAPRTRGGVRERRNLGLDDGAGGLVAMYAAQPHETAPERVLPESGGRYHGVFTYTVAKVLSEQRSPLTYRELAAEVAARYRGMGRAQPTPLLEGGGLDREVLGLAEWPDRPRIRLAGEIEGRPGHFRLEAGDLDGLTPGSVLTVYPPAGAAAPDEAIGHARVVELEALAAVVVPVAAAGGGWAPVAAGADGPAFPAGSRCAVRYVDFGDFQMRVALQRGEGEVLAEGAGPGVAEKALAAVLEGNGSLLRRVGDPAAAEWFVRLLGDDVVLVPASGWSDPGATGEPVPPAFRVGSLAAGDELAARLQEVLRTIARAHHLLALETTPGFGYDAVEVEVNLYTFDSRQDREGQLARWDRDGLVLEPGQWVGFEILNPSIHPVDVTLLFVDAGYGITPLFPRRGESNRLGPVERAFPVYKTRISADTVGEESVLAIAVKADGPPRSFAGLAQPTLERYRAADRTRGEGGGSPLDRLLESAAFGLETTRGLEAAEADHYAVTVLPWVTRAAP